MTSKPVISTSVRELVAFVLRAGDLGGGSGFGGRNRALEGTRGHQRLQKNRSAGYEAEVPVRWRVEEEMFIFELKGRIDGVLVDAGSLRMEEIKRRPSAVRGAAHRDRFTSPRPKFMLFFMRWSIRGSMTSPLK